MSELKIENIKTVDATKTPANAPKINEKIENTLTDTAEKAEKQEEKAVTKHIVTYLGNGEYTDNVGDKWHNGTEHTYSDDEYDARKDIHFMVKYGEMKHTAITI